MCFFSLPRDKTVNYPFLYSSVLFIILNLISKKKKRKMEKFWFRDSSWGKQNMPQTKTKLFQSLENIPFGAINQLDTSLLPDFLLFSSSPSWSKGWLTYQMRYRISSRSRQNADFRFVIIPIFLFHLLLI